MLHNKEINEDVLKKINKKDFFIRYISLIIGCFFTAFAFNVFFSPCNLVTGGVSGIAIIFKNVFDVPTDMFIIIAYFILLLLSFILLDKESSKKSIIGSILFPLFIYLTKDTASVIHFNVDNIILVAIFGGALYGIGSGLTFRYGFSTGGFDIVFQIMSKYLKISIGTSMKILNTLIILGSGFCISNGFYDWQTVMYAIIAVYIATLLTDKVILGISESKAFYIITEHETAIKSFLLNELGRGVTVLEGRGGYTGDRKKVIMCAIPTKQYFIAKEGILEIDKDAVILINDVYETKGIDR